MFSSDSSYLKSQAALMALSCCAPRRDPPKPAVSESVMRFEHSPAPTTIGPPAPSHQEWIKKQSAKKELVSFLGIDNGYKEHLHLPSRVPPPPPMPPSEPMPTPLPPPMPTPPHHCANRSNAHIDVKKISPVRSFGVLDAADWRARIDPSAQRGLGDHLDQVVSPLSDNVESIHHASAVDVSRGSGALAVTPSGDGAMRLAVSRAVELEQRITCHQNAHVKQRASLAVELDKARWDSEQAEFRLSELEASLQGMVQALRERISSRFSTVRQLREDSMQQVMSFVDTELKAIPRYIDVESREKPRLEQLASLQALHKQVDATLRIEGGRFAQALQNGLHGPQERLEATTHVATRQSKMRRDSTESMQRMIEQFSSQTRQQLQDLRTQRENFEAHMTERILKIANVDPRVESRHK